MENSGAIAEYAQERRDTMLNATLRVFAQSGFAEAKIDQIAAATDLSKASLHLFDPSKGLMLHSLLERYALLPELPEMMASLNDTPPALGMPTLIAEIWRLLRQRKELAHVISREIQCSAESREVFAEQLGPSSYQPLAGYLDRWMNRGVLRRQNALAAAQCMIGMLWFFLLTEELIEGKDLYPLSNETVVTSVARMFLDGPSKTGKHCPSHAAAGFKEPKSL
jgi:TetR/AcrR family transcriptional regulator, regulator of autoinduction and epiphytic fitness